MPSGNAKLKTNRNRRESAFRPKEKPYLKGPGELKGHWYLPPLPLLRPFFSPYQAVLQEKQAFHGIESEPDALQLIALLDVSAYAQLKYGHHRSHKGSFHSDLLAATHFGPKRAPLIAVTQLRT
jgi:hypothetical protein